MTNEERLKVAKALGQLDHVQGFAQIIHDVNSDHIESEEDDYIRGLYQGGITTVESLLPALNRAIASLEELVKGDHDA